MTWRDSNIQLFDLESDALPLRHEVLTDIGSKKNQKNLRKLEGQKCSCLNQMYFRKLVSQTDCPKIELFDLDVIRTRNLLIWSETRYHCATKSSRDWFQKTLLDCCVVKYRLCLRQMYFRKIVSQTDCLKKDVRTSM